jgi:hypothetical protein
MSLLNSKDSRLPILLSKNLGTMFKPMFKKPKPMFKMHEISPKDWDKPLLN